MAVAAADERVAETLVQALLARGYRMFGALEHDSGRLSTVRLVAPTPVPVVAALLFASSGIEAEIVRAAERIQLLPELEAPVARVGHLVAMKLLARDDRRRPQDYDDLRHLLAEADDVELARAREAVRLIQQRGFARGKALDVELEAMIAAR